MTDYRYQYQPRKKYACPNCGHKTLKRFIDTTTNQLCDEQYGVCERIFNCGYEKRPASEKVEREPIYRPPKIPFYFKSETMEATLNRYENNVLFNFLCKKFDPVKVLDTFNRYKVGTNDLGDTIFWQIDQQGRILYGNKIQYFSNGKRNKARSASCLHLAKGKGINGYDDCINEVKQCLFGSHLITDLTKTIRVVESEKTALICDIAKRDKSTLFLATTGLQKLKYILDLKLKDDQKVKCIPDTDGNELWEMKIKTLGINAEIEIIQSLQKLPKGSDIADLILNS